MCLHKCEVWNNIHLPLLSKTRPLTHTGPLTVASVNKEIDSRETGAEYGGGAPPPQLPSPSSRMHNLRLTPSQWASPPRPELPSLPFQKGFQGLPSLLSAHNQGQGHQARGSHLQSSPKHAVKRTQKGEEHEQKSGNTTQRCRWTRKSNSGKLKSKANRLPLERSLSSLPLSPSFQPFHQPWFRGPF